MAEELSGWVCFRMRGNIIGVFGVTFENKKRRLVDFCAERGLFIYNLYFKFKNTLEYTRVVRDQDGIQVMSMIFLGW